MSAERILITGATGFIGSYVVPLLLAQERELTLAVRRVESCPASWRQSDRIRIVATGDVETSSRINEAFVGVTAVVHLAGLAHVHGKNSRSDDTPFMAANAIATEKLADAARELEVKTFVNLSSLAAITGNASATVVDDDTADAPPTPYGRSKRIAEAAVSELRKQGIFSVSLRPPLVVGAGAQGNWGALQRLAATGIPLPFASVRSKRSMIGVRALAEAICHLCERPWPATKSGAYCLADPNAISLPELVTELRSGMGLPSRTVPFPPSALYAAAAALNQRVRAAGLLGALEVESSRFRREFAFVETQGLREAIRESGARYRGAIKTW